MSQTVSPSTSRCYGLARVSRAWRVSRAPACIAFSRERHRLRSPVAPVRQALVRMLTWPIISAGKSKRPTFTAKAIAKYGRDCALPGFARGPRRVRRVMGENGLLAPHRVGRNQEKTHDGTIVTDKVNEDARCSISFFFNWSARPPRKDWLSVGKRACVWTSAGAEALRVNPSPRRSLRSGARVSEGPELAGSRSAKVQTCPSYATTRNLCCSAPRRSAMTIAWFRRQVQSAPRPRGP